MTPGKIKIKIKKGNIRFLRSLIMAMTPGGRRP